MIRDATAADIAELLVLEKTAFPEDPWSRGMLEEELGRPGGIFIVDAADGAVRGVAVGWSILGELHVLQVAVVDQARRTGLGRGLMLELERRSAPADTAWLEVREDNVAARALYESLGYGYVATRARYYEDGCNALVFRRTL
jgi:ribosomal-protein-alanine acetyltransferase